MIFICECGQELHLRHNCETGMFVFGHIHEFDDYDDGNDEKPETWEFADGHKIIVKPKSTARGKVFLKRQE